MPTPKVIFEDETLMVLDKPPGLVVDKSETQQENTLQNWLEERLQNPSLERSGIVHRLDKDTSGLIVVAKTPEALENLQLQFASREVKKEYLALVHGIIAQGGVVEGAIGRNPANREKFIVLEEGKEAATEYQPEKHFEFNPENYQAVFEGFNKIQMRKLERTNYKDFTLVRCFPRTGRTHQIRVHLKYIGHPLVADEKYVGRKMSRLDLRWCPRQFLHAQKLQFRHPKSGQQMNFESPLPEDLEKVLDTLK